MKKLPVIGLIIGAIAAGFAIMKRKKGEEPEAAAETPDTNPPA